MKYDQLSEPYSTKSTVKLSNSIYIGTLDEFSLCFFFLLTIQPIQPTINIRIAIISSGTNKVKNPIPANPSFVMSA